MEKENTIKNIAVIFAGGVGKRMNNKGLPKQFLEIKNKPIIIHTIDFFEKNENIDGIVVVCNSNWIDYFDKLIYKYELKKILKVVPGGETGQLSIYNGLCAVKEIVRNKECIVLIHDGVRPLISVDLITRNIEDVKKYKSSITSSKVKETIVEVDDNGEITSVNDRAYSRIAKAPQCFFLNDILEAHNKALAEGKTSFIDCCTMMNYYNYKLHMTDDSYENIKITTQEDFYTMKAILQAREHHKSKGDIYE